MTSQQHHLEIEFLGTGTSTGVPQLGCSCDVCRSADPRDRRLRTSAIVRYCGKNILIDCGPDFRCQMLRAGNPHIDALLLTHIHYDHVGGIDELRGHDYGPDFPIFARGDVIRALHERLPYCFGEQTYPGAPQLHIHPVEEGRAFTVCGIPVDPIAVRHYLLPILGYRIGPLAYITDAKTIADDQIEALRGTPLLVVNALRIARHLSHQSLDEALELIERINPGQAWLVHMSHGIGLHEQVQRMLPPRVHLAYDTLRVGV